MNWLMVGHGALASLWAHHLTAAGEHVRFITRDVGQATPDIKHHPAAGKACPTTPHRVGQAAPDLKHHPAAGKACPTTPHSVGQARPDISYHPAAGKACPTFTLETNNTLQTRNISCISWSQLTRSDLNQAHVLIMVKAWQVDTVVQALANQLSQVQAKPAAIILSHNGLGAAEKALQQHSGWPLYDLVTTHGAWRKNPMHVIHAGLGTSYIGPRQQRRESACSTPPVWFPALANALPPMSWEPDILTRRWYKLAINCAINPLASLAGKANGELKSERYRANILAVCEEIERVANLVLGQGVVQQEKLVTQVYQVIEATAENTCSMLQDIQNGNPTEIDYLNGYIARLGEEFGIPTPANRRLQEEIRVGQDASASRSDDV